MSALGIFGGPKKRHALRGLGGVPNQWAADSRVRALQEDLNTRMQQSSCGPPLATEGLIGPLTCGALAWAKANNMSLLSYQSAAADIDTACKSYKLVTPTCAAPGQPIPPLAPAVPATHAPIMRDPPKRAAKPAHAPTAPLTHAPIMRDPPKRATTTQIPTEPVQDEGSLPLYVPVSPPPAPEKAGMSAGMKIGIASAAVALVAFAVFAKTKKKAA